MIDREDKKIIGMTVFCDFPYLAAIHRRLYDVLWGDRIDHHIVMFNGCSDAFGLWKDLENVTVLETRDRFEHGYALNIIYDCIQAHFNPEFLCLIESDYFILSKDTISQLEAMIQGKDIVGMIGHSMGPKEILTEFVSKVGFAWIRPFLAFMRKSALRRNLNFHSGFLPETTFIENWGNVDERGIWTDTMGGVCLSNFNKDTVYDLNVNDWMGYGKHVGSLTVRYINIFHRDTDYDLNELAQIFMAYKFGHWGISEEYNNNFLKKLRDRLNKKGLKQSELEKKTNEYIDTYLQPIAQYFE